MLDGWWAEAYDGTNGWAISGEVDADEQAQDERDADALRELLTTRSCRRSTSATAKGMPAGWLAMIRASLMTLAPQFSARRMVADYVEDPTGAGAMS